MCHRLFWIATGVLGYFLFTYLAGIVSGLLPSGEEWRGVHTRDFIIFSKISFWSVIVFLCYQLYKGDFNNLRIRLPLSSIKGKFVFVVGLIIGIVILYEVTLFVAYEIYSQSWTMRWITDYGYIKKIQALWVYLQLVWPFILPALLIMLLFKLRRAA